MAQSIAGEVLKEARSQASLSQGELAKAAGTYQSVVGRIEAGTSSPSVETLARLVKAAGFELRISLEPSPEVDPVIEAYKPDIDQSALTENLARSVSERLQAKGAAPNSADLARVIGVLNTHNIEFIITGGVAARVHGSARATQDIDIVYSRSDTNIARLAKALAPYNPYPRGGPPGLRFDWSTKTVKAGLNFSLATTLGGIDLLGETLGGGRYEDLAGHAVTEKLFGHATMVLSLPWLIRLKRAAGRVEDFEAMAELELLHELASVA